ncbi:MAG: hypothetical protein M1825_002836 [Sarcosagium campestre]|nr:MAG: hypothetical protein M1825_002836 [Sarcosagium campestre]
MFTQAFRVLSLVLLVIGSVRCDADFESVRTTMKRDRSGKRGDPKQKYFHESVFHPHYDGRFAERPWPYKEAHDHLIVLTKCYLATMASVGAETWINHGSLLGWWWNQKIMPWDSDVDVQVSESTMHFLASYYNMTSWHYELPGVPGGRDFLLEVNPHYVNPERSDWLNVIDSRFTDKESGLFIDMTTVRRNETHPEPGMMTSKDGHEFKETDLFPLRSSLFEGMPVKIPYAYAKLLTKEYGQKALTRTNFQRHKFNPENNEWELQQAPQKPVAGKPPGQ